MNNEIYTIKTNGFVQSLNEQFKVTAKKSNDGFAVEFLIGSRTFGVRAKTVELVRSAIHDLVDRLNIKGLKALKMIDEGERLVNLLQHIIKGLVWSSLFFLM